MKTYIFNHIMPVKYLEKMVEASPKMSGLGFLTMSTGSN